MKSRISVYTLKEVLSRRKIAPEIGAIVSKFSNLWRQIFNILVTHYKMKNWPNFWQFTGFIALTKNVKEQQQNISACLRKASPHPSSFLLPLQIETQVQIFRPCLKGTSVLITTLKQHQEIETLFYYLKYYIPCMWHIIHY